jgi:hypothetical protein
MNDKKLEDRITHVLSEWLNDNAPIGEERYRAPAKAVIDEVLKQSEKINKLKEELELAHAHIHNVQDAYNECRNWFSNVEFIPESEDLDEYISLEDCDEKMAVALKSETEDFAMGWFRYWYSLIKDEYQIKSLHEYMAWSDKNLDILSSRIKARQVFKEIDNQDQ